ncbi:hypothetical protein LPJ53_003582 [Coemansia erecta]|uniref:Small acidic protein n=1 Tax=Coemansia erecta TaxID=147472 RepID=A0A9W7XVZ2_9FUNG|nr:hypothetical protein LPJ53_003582 [Coemansia erecta]
MATHTRFDSDTEVVAKDAKKSKDKKDRKSRKHSEDSDAGSIKAKKSEDRKEKEKEKEKSSKKRKSDLPDSGDDEKKKKKKKSKKDKKDKTSKKEKKSKSRKAKESSSSDNGSSSSSSSDEEDKGKDSGTPAAASGWNNWMAADLGSKERTDKFLRLMGVRNVKDVPAAGNAGGASPFESAISTATQARINQDLQKGFDAAMSKRNQGMRGGAASRGGLGF